MTSVGGVDVAKVIDFGIARALDGPLLEDDEGSREFVLGSPPYISPETLRRGGRHRLDARSDVYCLGLLLYELLVGVVPFSTDRTTLWTLLRRISEVDPQAPSRRFEALEAEDAEAIARRRRTTAAKLSGQISGDLDAIVSKALDPDPLRRYGSPGELADDLARRLDDLPIEARPRSFPYVVRRFARRHTGSVIAGSLVLLTLGAGLVSRSMEAERTRRALVEAELVRDFLVGLFEGADPERRIGKALTVRELLDQGADRLRTELTDRPLTRAIPPKHRFDVHQARRA